MTAALALPEDFRAATRFRSRRHRARIHELAIRVVAAKDDQAEREVTLDELFAAHRPTLHSGRDTVCQLCVPADVEIPIAAEADPADTLMWFEIDSPATCAVCLRRTCMAAYADSERWAAACESHDGTAVLKAIATGQELVARPARRPGL